VDYQINKGITEKEVRLIGVDGDQLGIYKIEDALTLADEENLDLVNVSPSAMPPVCKIIDFGKFKYEQERKEKDIRKNQKTVGIKEIRLSVRIDEHDYQTKLRNVQKFILAGNKVKVSILFKGREVVHSEIGMNILNRLAEDVSSIASFERKPKLEGQQIIMVLSPKLAA
jgi:translation initiation factor IF-3